MLNKQGQSTVEYIILVTVVITVILLTIPTVIKQYKKALLKTSKDIHKISNRLSKSHGIKKDNGHHYGQYK